MASINIDERNLKEGVLGLVLAIVEIIKDTLKAEAVRRMDGGRLSALEIDRLGKALNEMDQVIEEIKEEQGVASVAASVRDGLDKLVNNAFQNFDEIE